MTDVGKKQAGLPRSIGRGFAVLSAVNRMKGASPTAVALETGLPRPTVYRILATLESLGYVRRDASDGRVRVTRLAQSLGDGFRSDTVLSEVAPEVLARLGVRVLWPVDVAVYEDCAMVVQETTHSTSPFSLDRGVLGRRLPMVASAAGRVYLAHCAEGERNAIIDQIERAGELEMFGFSRARFTALLDRTRAQGYSVRYREDVYVGRTSSIGLPLRVDGRVIGTLTMIWITRAIGLEGAISRFLEPMREACAEIEAMVGARQGVSASQVD